MTIRDAKRLVFELLSYFYSGATSTYAKQSNVVKPQAPYVTLSTISTNRPMNPPTAIVDGQPVGYYPTTMIVQIDLFTNGDIIPNGDGTLFATDNTALSDLVDFYNFIGSEYCINWCHKNDMAIIPNGDPRDTTELLNNSSYQFRATLELSVRFTQKAVGYAGILSESSIKHETPVGEESGDDTAPDTYIEPEIAPNPSGGGSVQIVQDADETIGYFTSAKITETKEE